MSVKERGGYYCPRCKQRVIARKNTRKTKRVGHGLGALMTGGATLAYTAASEGNAHWHCSICGGPAHGGLTAVGLEAKDAKESGQTDSPAEIKARRNAAKKAGRAEAFCAICWHRIYYGDAKCPSGHNLREGWEDEFYRRQGTYPEVEPDKPEDAYTPAKDAASPEPAAHEKLCPYCAETIKAAAIKCKHCGSDLDDQRPGSTTSRPRSRKRRL